MLCSDFVDLRMESKISFINCFQFLVGYPHVVAVGGWASGGNGFNALKLLSLLKSSSNVVESCCIIGCETYIGVPKFRAVINPSASLQSTVICFLCQCYVG